MKTIIAAAVIALGLTLTAPVLSTAPQADVAVASVTVAPEPSTDTVPTDEPEFGTDAPFTDETGTAPYTGPVKGAPAETVPCAGMPLGGAWAGAGMTCGTVPPTVTVPDAVPTEGPGTVIYPSLLPPCDDEDGTVMSDGVPVDACYWDASVRGNGTGTSFISIR